MKLKDVISTIVNILSVVFILLSVLVTVLIFSTNNRYSEPVFGNTMLLSVREDSVADAPRGALAVVDLTRYSSERGNYVAFIGRGARITRDPMACIGTVKFYIPLLGGVVDFFRNSLGFFFVIILPLFLLVIWHVVRIVLLVRHGEAEQVAEAGRTDGLAGNTEKADGTINSDITEG
ncbi:MAG: hypothetical protein GX057_00075 [Clostridiales bacterium]|jgi:hypothetical protein|nr:hypothetical protein [Clostridiales bacterium]